MRKIKIAMALAPAVAAGLVAAGAAAAHSAPLTTRYVSPTGQASGSDFSCGTAAYSSINAAIAASSSGDTVVACAGTYHAQVLIKMPLTLIGRPGAVIDAAGQSRLNIGGKLPGSIGIGVVSTNDVQVSGFKVEDAGFDAILVAMSSHVTVSDNVLMHNGDVGVNLNGSSWSRVNRNISEDNNGGGFMIADDNGLASHNMLAYNVASHNPGGGGVIMAGHRTAGVTDNTIADNLLTYNGTLAKNSGAGVAIATVMPKETVADNTVTGNNIYGNGLAGVTIHAHMPGQNLNGNRIINNTIGMNGTLADRINLVTSPSSTKNVAVADTETTGILVGAASPIQVQVSGNNITGDHYGMFFESVGAAAVHVSLHGNRYHGVDILVNHLGS